MREAGEGNGEAKQEKEAAESGEAETEAAQASDELAAKVQKLEEELKEARQRVVYTLAEMENVRAIARRDAETARKFAVQGFAKGLLDVADNLSRAIEAVPKEGEKDPALTVLLEGVEMTEAQLHKAFAAQNLERYGAPGDAFDPNLHDALYEYEDPSLSPGSVGQVMKPGYKLHGRVIRAAQVGCVKKQ
ncbi:GrpE nucleotide exchange factor [Tribonema minus]|uniref:GrpE nucleotide exchange factor n=1 Tax=Tribonema minus TaxID=303371 RepID=A0A835ZC72_9STRA|nr:GrpE nucleotide exchange factor [Tribonema minus]